MKLKDNMALEAKWTLFVREIYQLEDEIANDQISLKEFTDSFTGDKRK